MSAALRSYMQEQIDEARKILAEPGTGPNLRWLAETTIRQWEAWLAAEKKATVAA